MQRAGKRRARARERDADREREMQIDNIRIYGFLCFAYLSKSLNNSGADSKKVACSRQWWWLQ